MKHQKSKTVGSILSSLALAITILALVSCSGLNDLRADDNRAPTLTGTQTNIMVPSGNKVSFHVYAEGVQIYRATAAATGGFVWTFTGPEAVLFDADGNVVGIHYAFAGPTRPAWETESGSFVVGSVVPPRITVDPTAVPWLLLSAVTNSGPGVLDRTTFIQRVNTTGGLAPSAPPTELDQEAPVPYTAEYFFYRESK